jgi:hypothetical protein
MSGIRIGDNRSQVVDKRRLGSLLRGHLSPCMDFLFVMQLLRLKHSVDLIRNRCIRIISKVRTNLVHYPRQIYFPKNRPEARTEEHSQPETYKTS